MKPIILVAFALAGIAIAFVLFSPDPEVASADAADARAAADLTLDIHQWDVPWENTRPRDPDVAPDGTVWFVGQAGDYLGHLDPATGEMERFPLPDGAGPHNVIVDADGYPWYAGNRDAHIGRMDPATGEITRYDMPEGVNDPHTLVWNTEGDIWFTVQRSQPAGYVGRLDTSTGEVQVVQVPGESMRPYGIKLDSRDRPWIAFMGTNAIGMVDPATMELTLHRTPDERSIIRRLAITSDDRVWWVDARADWFGVYDPAADEMRQWKTPGEERTALYAMAADNQDRVWYVETGLDPNRFIGFDTATEEFISVTEVPSGGGSVRHMVFDEASNAIWFGTDDHTIGRAVVP
jgi:virginiamycin B lyase